MNCKPYVSQKGDAGYGTSYQAGVVALLDQLLIGQGREPLRSRR